MFDNSGTKLKQKSNHLKHPATTKGPAGLARPVSNRRGATTTTNITSNTIVAREIGDFHTVTKLNASSFNAAVPLSKDAYLMRENLHS